MRGIKGYKAVSRRVGESIAEHKMWDPDDRVAVAVSGGVDSVVLLNILVDLQRWHKGNLEVVTVNHGTRDGSAADADFVCELATSLGMIVHRHDYSLGPDASEEACRNARFDFFDSLDVDKVVLGHHMNDQAETVLLNLIRGAGVTGRAAMLPIRGKYVRPMLDIPRADIMMWSTGRNIEYREDPSNKDPKYSRNRVRNEVIPLLEDIRRGATKSLAISAKIAAGDKTAIDSMVEKYPVLIMGDGEGIMFGRHWAMGSPDSVLFRVIDKYVDRLTYNKFQPIKKVIARGHGVLQLSPLAQLRVNNIHVIVERL